MQVIYEICCGIDVHKQALSACLRIADNTKKEGARYISKEFLTFSRDITELLNWLTENKCNQVIIESTGVYWKPIVNILDSGMNITLANARHVKNLPGKKTDKSDAKWLSDLLAHGLVKPSFIPPKDIDMLRLISRDRGNRVKMRSTEKNRIHKYLECANIKLSSVVSNIFGVSGMLILEALSQHHKDPKLLSQMAKGRLKSKIPQLELALESTYQDYHGYLIEKSLEAIKLYTTQIKEMDYLMKNLIEKYEVQVEQLVSIPGVSYVSALVIISEIGADMSRFGNAKRLAAWAGVCPGNNESAGKRRSGKTPLGNKYLKSTLVQISWAARKTNSFLGLKFRSLETRLGKKKAAVAIAHKIIIIIYNLLDQGTFYDEERNRRLQERSNERRLKYACKLLQQHGYQVEATK